MAERPGLFTPPPCSGCPGPGYLEPPNTLQHLLVLLGLHLEGLKRAEVWEARDTGRVVWWEGRVEPWL